MKRPSILFVALCLSTFVAFFVSTLRAEPVSKQAALYTAQNFMLAKGKSLATPSASPRRGAKSSSEEGEDYYYIFNAGNDGGYVIVSGDDRIEPVLGYVEQGTFDPDNIPENMRSWLQMYTDEIKYVVENNIQPNDPRIKKRNKVAGTKHSIPELLKSRWNQGHPYNLTCPNYYTEKDNDEHQYPASGCVATAMSQVVYFYKFPQKIKTTIPSHSNTYTLKNGTKKTVTVNSIPRNTVIDWEYMRDTYSCNDSHVHDRPDTAVANLMLYCGQGVKMGWGASSGAATSRARDFFVTYFGYDERAYWGGRGSYSIDEWFDMLYNEIEEGYPVLYAGHSSGGGHAFVLDGFDGDNLFHVNWGWGGGSNGWFLVSILNPGDNSGIGASSSSDGYSMSQGALFNLRTPGTPKENVSLSISDVSVSGTRISAKFTNKTGASGNFNTGIVMMNEDGSLSLVGTRQSISGMAADASATKTFTISASKLPGEGTYKLSPASKTSKGDVWIPKYTMHNTHSQYIEAVVDSLGHLSVHFKNPTEEAISIDTIVFPGTRIVNQEQEVKVTFRNDGAEYFKTIYLFASTTDTKVYTDSKSMVAVRSGETIDVSYFFKPTETGTYNLWFCTDDKGSNVMGTGTMEVITEAEATKANLAISSYTISNGSDGIAYGKSLVGKATIRNNGTQDYHGSIKLQIWSQKIGSSTAYSGSTRTFNVDILRGKTASIDFEFDNLNDGYYYRFKATYGNQDGTLTSGGIWDHKFEVRAGILFWKSDGTITGKAYSSTMTADRNTVGLYANCDKINRMTPNRTNTNAIYAFAADMELPTKLDTSNVVSGNHSNRVKLVNDKPYYIPKSFDADSASFTYTFDATEDGTKWHTFTMPFEPDSIFLDDALVALDDTLKHFWIYEFAAQNDNGEVVFVPVKTLRSGTPYIIAADSTMAGRSIVFRSLNVPFYKTGSDKMLVTSPDYKFHGNTLAPKVKDCYVLNADGTAFEYTTTNKTLNAMGSYFTTNLPEEERLPSIVLPDIPVAPVLEVTLDEMAGSEIVSGCYNQLTLKRTFEAGWNTICLPFAVDDVLAVFGQGAKAYKFCGFVDNELDLLITYSLEAGKPYIIYVPDAITEDIVLTDVTIDEESTEAGYIGYLDTYFRGTYIPIIAGERTRGIHGLAADGSVVELQGQDQVKGFRGFFELPGDAQNVMIHPYDDPTGLKGLKDLKDSKDLIYNLAGQRMVNVKWSNSKSHGIYIINGKKTVK